LAQPDYAVKNLRLPGGGKSTPFFNSNAWSQCWRMILTPMFQDLLHVPKRSAICVSLTLP